tara:strand:- start:244 stop:744 length:501 start_codon:yes stop_codon:yes gene_type:complete
MAIKNKALFLDRDGVINKKMGYVYSTQKFIWLKNVKKAIKYAYDNKYKIIVITNQSGVARGLYSERDIVKLHKTINKELKVSKCKIHDFFYCPYHPKYGNKKYRKDSYLRKPNPGMIVKAVKKWNVDIGKSLMIGDSNSDLIAAKRSNLRFVKKKYNLLREIKNNL